MDESTRRSRYGLRGFQIGGERSYGWGRIEGAVVCSPFSGDTSWSGWRFNPVANAIQVTADTAGAATPPRALAHVDAKAPNAAHSWSGVVEPLLGRNTQKRVPGRIVSIPAICFVPGARYLGSLDSSWKSPTTASGYSHPAPNIKLFSVHEYFQVFLSKNTILSVLFIAHEH